MSATWPRRCRCCGRCAEGEPPRSTTARIGISDAVERLRAREPARRAARARRDARPSRRVGPLRLAQAGDRRAAGRDQRAARQAGAGRRVRARRRGGRGGVARAAAALRRAVRLGRRARRAADARATCRCSARSCSPTRSTRRRSSLDDYAAEWKWDGIRVQLVHAGGETRLYSRTGDDISGSFPDVAEAFATRGVLDGELLVRGVGAGRRRAWRRGGELQRAAATARPQERQRQDAGRISGVRPALRHLVRRRGGSARAAVERAAGAARALRRRRSIPSGSTCRS